MRKIYILTSLYILVNAFSLSAQLANWSALLPAFFPTNASGQIHGISRVSQLKFHPTSSSKMYAVSARGGLFISTNGGTNWNVAPGCDVMPSSSFASVCIDITNDQVIYLGAGDHNYYSLGGAAGVWKSTNGGTTFTQTTLNNKIIVEMVMDPNDHNVIVAVTDGGVYKTINGGSSWTLKTASRQFDDLKQKTPTSRVLFAATRDSAFFRSPDFGDTWSQITSGIVLPSGVTNGNGCRVAVTPADTNVVYLGMVANSGLIYKSTDGGTSFTAMKTTVPPYLTYYDNLSTSSGQGDYNFGIGVDRVNANILYLVAHNVWKSTDGGATWAQLTNWYAKVHTDMHQVIVSPYNTGQVWDMNDGGVWLSTDGGNNWVPKSDGIYGYEIYHGSCSPTRRDMVTIGTQDNGELYANSTAWFTNRGGDWQSHGVFDYRANSSMVYYFDPDWGGIPLPKRRLVNGSDASYGLPATATNLSDIAFNRSNINLAFAADTLIFRTTNLTVTTPSWTEILNTGRRIVAVHSSVADANRLYVITDNQLMYVSTNALSVTPTFTSYALPNTTNNAASITTVKLSPNTIYVTCNTKVYRSTDNGVNWTNITYNLPSVNHVRVLADEYYSANELVFIASNNAVYYKTVSAGSWTIYNTNLPSRTSIVDMSIYNDSTSNTLLRVATYGRGIWETAITNLHSLNAAFAADNTNPCAGTTVQFSDLSVGNVTSRSWSFPGGTPPTSTSATPSVVYNANGSYNVTLTVSDGVSNSTATQTNYIVTAGTALPLTEGFEGATDPPSGWKNIDKGTAGYLWTKTSVAGGFGTSANSMFFDNYSWNVPGEKDELQVERLDFSGFTSLTLTFDVAYQVYSGYSDSLVVLISTDCGTNFTRVYNKGGSTLSTAGSATADFVPTAAQWRTETVNLNAYVGQANVIVEFQNVNGFGNNLYIDNINMNGTPATQAAIAIALSAGTNPQCAGASVTFTAFPTNGGTTPVYQWKINGTNTGTNSTTFSTSSLTNGQVVTCVMTSNLPGVTGNPATSNAITMTVNSLVAASVAIAAVPAGAICPGTNVTFTATPTNGGAPVYQWKKNGTNVGSNSATYADAALTNGNTITCDMTSTTACVTGSPATSNTITMVVNPNVTAGVSIAAVPAGAICSGTNVTFTATPTNGGTPSYQWTKNGTNVGTNSVTYADAGLANGNTINCLMTSTALCVTGSPATSATITMSVNSSVAASVAVAAVPAGAICPGTSVTFTATPTNGGTPSYQWKKNGTNVGTNSATYTDAGLADGNTITCVMTSSVTCVTGSPATSNTIAMTVNPNVVVGVSIAAVPSGPICAGTSVVFTATPVNGGASPAYQWRKNGTITGITTPTYTDANLSNGNVILCRLISNAPCVSGNPATSSLMMTVNPNVTAGVSIAAVPSGTICPGTNVTFTPTPVNGGTPSYQWKKNSTNVGNANTFSSSTLANNDTLKCVMTSNAACVSGSPATSNSIITMLGACTLTINLKAFIEGFYIHGADSMVAVIDPSNQPTLCDTVTLELADSASLLKIATSKAVINTHGQGIFNFTGLVSQHRYYIIFRHRNSLETWSKYSFLFSSSTMNFDFTTP